jgi:hypothetical protein
MNQKFQSNNIEEAMIENFNRMDFKLQTESGKTEIAEITNELIFTRNRG